MQFILFKFQHLYYLLFINFNLLVVGHFFPYMPKFFFRNSLKRYFFLNFNLIYLYMQFLMQLIIFGFQHFFIYFSISSVEVIVCSFFPICHRFFFGTYLSYIYIFLYLYFIYLSKYFRMQLCFQELFIFRFQNLYYLLFNKFNCCNCMFLFFLYVIVFFSEHT